MRASCAAVRVERAVLAAVRAGWIPLWALSRLAWVLSRLGVWTDALPRGRHEAPDPGPAGTGPPYSSSPSTPPASSAPPHP